MAFSHSHTKSVSTTDGQVSKTTTVSASQQIAIDEAIADSITDDDIIMSLDFSACVSFYIVSDQDVTVETNDGTTPDDTLALLADIPYIWHTGCYDTFLITADVTVLYITNASGSTANISIRALIDATP